MIYVFGDYALDMHLYELRHGGSPCPLGPQVFNVLAYLIVHRDRVVTKEELIEQLWPAQFVSDATVHQHVTAARKATGDRGRQQRIIKTLRSRGYRFIAPVRVLDDEALGRDGPVASEVAHHRARQILQPAVEAPPTFHGAFMGERKLVTVLCGTLANAVPLVEHLGFEALPRLRQALLDLVHHEVQPYQGTLQAVGNGSFLVLFGVPVALEDHARRAVLAGLALQRRLQQPYTDPVTQHEVAFEVCLGVHTGPVMVGSHASEAQQPPTVVGEVMHHVARLQQLAAPGMLIGSANTLQFLDGEVCSDACGSVAIPGRPKPLKAYTIQALGPWRASPSWPTGRTLSRFAGREREMAVLDALLAQAVQGQGHVVGIMGEPGMGKSRLLYEFVQQLPSKAVTYVEGHCLSYGSATPYLPVLDLVRHLCGITDADGPETLAAKVHGSLGDTGGDLTDDAPYLLHLLGVSDDAERLATLGPQALKTRTFATLKQLSIQRSRRQPLVLAVEDLHWIDLTSEEWLASLVESLAPIPLLLLTTYRPGYRPLWTDKSYATQLALTRLTPEASRAVVQSVPQSMPLSDALRREIVGKAAGNPFFLEELTRAVVAHTERHATLVIPDTVQAVLAARMDQLPPEVKRLLQTAAVIGMDVPLPLLQAVAELPDDALNRGLAHLQAVEFLYETRRFPEREYTFKHALTREVAYEALLQERRRTLHARIIEIIEVLSPDRLAEQVDRLAHHAIRGEVWDKAVTYGRQAGAKAAERSALREAAEAFEQALTALQHLPDSRTTREQAIDLRFDLRNALHLLNEEGRILNHLRQAEPLAEALGDQRRLGQLAGYLSVCLRHQGNIDEALASAQRALAIGTTLGDVGLQVAANSFLGELYLWVLNDYRQAVEAFRQNVEILHGALLRERFGTTNVQSVVSRAQVARCLAELGAFAEGRAYGEDALRLAETVDHPYSLMWACSGLGHLCLRQGALSQAIHVFERALAIREIMNLPGNMRHAFVELGAAYALSGRVSEALPLMERGLEQSVPSGIWGQSALLPVWLGEGYVLAGRLEEAMQLGKQALEVTRTQKQQGYQAYALRLLGDIAAHHTPPAVEEAERHYREALAVAEAIGMRPLMAHCHLGLGTLYAKAVTREQARAELSAAIELYRAMEMTFWLPQAEAALAQVAGC
jgi:predicted ATPase/DNA-binding winged helix-turn-helix (wHTH) protein